MDAQVCPGPGTIHTDNLEELVYDEMRKKLALFPQLHPRRSPDANPVAAALNVELAQLDNEISALMNRLAAADDALFRYINQRIAELDAKKQAVRKKLSQSTSKEPRPGTRITSHLTLWAELSFDDKRQTADLLIKVIHAVSGRIQIEWRL